MNPSASSTNGRIDVLLYQLNGRGLKGCFRFRTGQLWPVSSYRQQLLPSRREGYTAVSTFHSSQVFSFVPRPPFRPYICQVDCCSSALPPSSGGGRPACPSHLHGRLNSGQQNPQSIRDLATWKQEHEAVWSAGIRTKSSLLTHVRSPYIRSPV